MKDPFKIDCAKAMWIVTLSPLGAADMPGRMERAKKIAAMNEEHRSNIDSKEILFTLIIIFIYVG